VELRLRLSQPRARETEGGGTGPPDESAIRAIELSRDFQFNSAAGIFDGGESDERLGPRRGSGCREDECDEYRRDGGGLVGGRGDGVPAVQWDAGELDGEKNYAAGLLHDIGFLVNCLLFPGEFSKAADLARQEGMPMDRAELATMGSGIASRAMR
jgi:hypothetical protein